MVQDTKHGWYSKEMNRRTITVAATLIIALIAGIVVLLNQQSAPQTLSSTAIVNNVSYDVHVETAAQLVVGEETTVRIRVIKDGKPFEVDEEGRLLHVMIVSANLRDTFHTYSPIRERVGVYSVQHAFTEAGPYRIWTEFDDTSATARHDQHAEQIAYAEVTVSGTSSSVSELVGPSEAVVDGYQVRLTTSHIDAEKPTTLRVSVTDVAGKPVQLFEHEPFLYFMSGENFSFFRHGHGITLPDGSAGLENTFPKAGKYVWWLNLHLMRGNTVEEVQIPFLLTVS